MLPLQMDSTSQCMPMATTDLKELALGQFSSLRGMKIQRVIVILFGDNHSVCVCVCVFLQRAALLGLYTST